MQERGQQQGHAHSQAAAPARSRRRAVRRLAWLCLCLLIGLLLQRPSHHTWAAEVGDVFVSDSVFPASLGGADAPTVRVGVYGCLDESRCWRPQQERLAQLWLDHVSRTPILGRYRVQLLEVKVTQTPSYNRTELWVATQALLNAPGGPPGFLLLPVGNTVWGDTIMPTLEAARIVTMAATPLSTQYICSATTWRSQVGCAAPNSRRWRYANSILNSGQQYFSSFLGMLRVEQVRHLAIIQVRSMFFDEVSSGVRTTAEQLGMRITFDSLAEPHETNVQLVLPAVVDATIASLAGMTGDDMPDVLFLIVFSCQPWIAAMKRAGYTPKSLAAIRCVDTDHVAHELGDDLRYVSGPGQWSETMVTPDYVEDADSQPWAMYPSVRGGERAARSTALQFADAYRHAYNLTSDASPSYGDASWLACLSALEGAMWQANSTDPVRVQEAMNALYQPSFFGTLSFNRFGINDQKTFVTLQRDARGTMHIIDPFIAATMHFIYPMPKWDEREYSGNVLGSPVEIVFVALMLACMLLTIGLLSYLYWHRRRQVVSAAGLPFYFVMGLGCLLAYASILTWPVDNNAATCRSRVWLWSGAFYLLVAPILASSYRIARIASLVGTYQKTTVSMAHTRAIAVLVALPQLVVNVVWSIAAPFEAQLITPDPLRPALGFTSCEIPNDVGRHCLLASLVFMFLALAVVCVLAWKIRHVGTLFNDARPLGQTMYLFALVSVLLLAVHATLPQSRRRELAVLFAIRSGAVLLVYQTAILLLFMRRFLHKNSAVSPASTLEGTGAVVPRATFVRPPGLQLGPIHYQRPLGGEGGAIGYEHSKAAHITHGQATQQRHTPMAARAGAGAGAAPAGLAAAGSACAAASECSRSASSSLLGVVSVPRVPRFHLPPHDEYVTWGHARLVALLDEATGLLRAMHASVDELEAERERQRQRKGTDRRGANSLDAAGAVDHAA